MVALFSCHRRKRRGVRQPRVTARSALRNGRSVETMCAEDPPTESPKAEPLHGDVLVAIATYNERDNIPQLVDEILGTAADIDVLIVDDNSPDGTGTWCAERAAVDRRVYCLQRAGKLGLGTAVIAGLRYAIERDYAYVVNMDADWSHPPRVIPQLVAGVRGPTAVDVMIGSRYVPGGAIRGWSPWRHVMSRLVNLYARLLLGLDVRDCSGSFRCYRTERLRKLDFDAFRARGYAFFEEILWRLRRTGACFGEVPIVFEDRRRGRSKINSGEAVRALGTILRLGLERWWRSS